MYFQSLTLHNFGIYKGTHTLNFTSNEVNKNITLIGGMNGRGKTTILDSIFLTLYGKRSLKVIQDENISYSKLLFNHINKSANDDCTYVQLELIFEEDNSTHLIVKREWINDDKPTDNLTITKNGILDYYLSENWDYYVEQILPLGIARFFFFDNEKISQIADDDSFNKIKDSIKSLMGINTIDRLIDDMNKLIKSKGVSSSLKQNENLHHEQIVIENELSSIEQNISQLVLERASSNQKLQIMIKQLEKIESDFWKAGGDLGLKRTELKDQKHTLIEYNDALKQQALELAANPATPLTLCKSLLINSFNHIKQIESMKALKYSEHIISDLYNNLLLNFEHHFYNTSTLENIKSILSKEFKTYQTPNDFDPSLSLTPSSNLLLENLLSTTINNISSKKNQLINEFISNENSLLQLESHLNNNIEEGQSLILLNKLRELESEKGRLESYLVQKDNELHSLEYKKKTLTNRLDKIIKTIYSTQNSEDDNERIVKYAYMTIQVMNKFKLRQQEKKVSQLEHEIMNCFNYLAQKESIISGIEIKPDTLDIIIKDYKGGELLKNQLSAGEKQMFAISILWGLARSSGYQLPVVIDTPLARLDSAHRHNFVNRYLPNASNQVIVLSTDEEIYGSYLRDISPYVSSFYTLLYSQENKYTSIIPGYFEEAK